MLYVKPNNSITVNVTPALNEATLSCLSESQLNKVQELINSPQLDINVIV